MTSNISVFFSETRLVEIMDNLCSESEVCIVITLLNLPPVVILFQFPTIHPCYFLINELFQCHSMVEQYEEVIEQWWFKHFAQQKDTSLHNYLCVERVPLGRHSLFNWSDSDARFLIHQRWLKSVFQLVVLKASGDDRVWTVLANLQTPSSSATATANVT